MFDVVFYINGYQFIQSLDTYIEAQELAECVCHYLGSAEVMSESVGYMFTKDCPMETRVL